MQKITAVKIIANVVIASCHKSTRSIEIKDNDVIIANLTPFVLKAKYANIRTTIGKGMKFKRFNLEFFGLCKKCK